MCGVGAASVDDRRAQLVGAVMHPPHRGGHHFQQPHLHQDPVPGPVREPGPHVPQPEAAGAHPADVLCRHLSQGLPSCCCTPAGTCMYPTADGLRWYPPQGGVQKRKICLYAAAPLLELGQHLHVLRFSVSMCSSWQQHHTFEQCAGTIHRASVRITQGVSAHHTQAYAAFVGLT